MKQANTDGFRWLPSYYEALRNLPNKDRLALYDALLDYGFGNEPGEIPARLQGYMTLILPTLKASVSFEAKQKENGKYGVLGGRPKKTQNGEEEKPSDGKNKNPTPEKPKTQDDGKEKPSAEDSETLDVDIDVDIDVDVEERGADKPPPRPRFVPPSVEEVRAHCREKGYAVDPEAFVAFYASKGWKVGSAPMRDWRAAVVTWVRRDGGTQNNDPWKRRTPDLRTEEEKQGEYAELFRKMQAANAEVAGDG